MGSLSLLFSLSLTISCLFPLHSSLFLFLFLFSEFFCLLLVLSLSHVCSLSTCEIIFRMFKGHPLLNGILFFQKLFKALGLSDFMALNLSPYFSFPSSEPLYPLFSSFSNLSSTMMMTHIQGSMIGFLNLFLCISQ